MDNNQRLWEAIFRKIQIKRNEGASELQKYLGSCLRMATRKNNLDLVKKLIEEENADPNNEDNDGINSIMIAAENEYVTVLEYFLSLSDKVDINAQEWSGCTALHIACYKGFDDVVKILLGSPRLDVNKFNNLGNTPLYYASNSGNEAIVSMLLSNRDIQVNKANKTNDMITPLIRACMNEHPGVVRLLLSRNDIDVNSRDSLENRTALMYSCSSGSIEIVRCLLDHKDIDVNLEDNSHLTALLLACRQEHALIVTMLFQREDLQKTRRNLLNIMDVIMKRRVTEKDIGAFIERAVSLNNPDDAVWLLKFDGSRNLGLRFYQDLLTKATEHRHLGLVQYLKDEKLVEAPNCDTPSTQGASALLSDQNQKDCDEEKSSNRNRGVCANTTCNVPGVHRCGRCKKVAYCGTECQHEHWSVHQEECKPPEKMKKTKKKREKEDDGNQGQNSEVK